MPRSTLPSGTPLSLARPGGDATRGVVVVPDIWGLRPLFDDLVARLASEHGWAVAAVEPFPGQSLSSTDVAERFAAMPGLSDARLLGDLAAAADLLGTERTAVLGFCMGGMVVHKAMGTGRFDRGVSFYGMVHVPEDWKGADIGEPLDALHRMPDGAEVLAFCGGRDPYTPERAIAELAEVEGVTVVVYPDADHGFVHDPSRPTHRPDDAADAWERTTAFLQ